MQGILFEVHVLDKDNGSSNLPIMYTNPTLKEIIGQTDSCLVILSSKTYVF